ncbi:AMP-binding protein [Pseudonocardia sp. H11422]|uniref:AMP-binding protein n=1 Tax=Pseudonocardia sp. H11422 TaxID=2835866 RepID=UPI0020294770|nr:AMP-binding protein [Pseudonocardia sp. H11422]
MLTHRNLVANLEQNRVGRPVAPDDVLSASLPFFHTYGFTIILNSGLLAGATVVTLPRYELGAYLRMVQDHRVTRAFLAPPMVLGIATAPDVESYDLSSLRVALSGAAPLDIDVTERAEARLGCRIRQGYGMTEAAPGTNQVPDADVATTPAGSVGRLLAGTEAGWSTRRPVPTPSRARPVTSTSATRSPPASWSPCCSPTPTFSMPR